MNNFMNLGQEQEILALRAELALAQQVNAAYAALPIPELTKQQSDQFQAALRAARLEHKRSGFGQQYAETMY